MPNYLWFIPYVNRLDLLERALASIDGQLDRTVVVDNSDDSHLSLSGTAPRLYKPPVPLGFSQSQNLFQRIALAAECDFFCFMHSDAACEGDAAKELIDYVTSLDDGWGMVFTNYDALCCFNAKAVRQVGEWDWRGLPWYHADNDYYRRMKLAGVRSESAKVSVLHTPSQTRAADPTIYRQVQIQIFEAQRYYEMKWGGAPGHETYQTPFNGEIEPFEKMVKLSE